MVTPSEGERGRAAVNEPRRLLDDPSELLAEERELLGAGQRLEPPEGLSSQLWPSLSSKLALAVAPLERGQSPLKPSPARVALGKSGVGAALVKGALIVVVIGVAGFVGARLWRGKNEPRPSAVTPALSVSARPSAAASATVAESDAVTAELAPPVSASTKPSAAVPRSTTVTHSTRSAAATPQPAASSDVREESRAVAAARDALRSGNALGALGLLEQARQRFGAGVLGQEREALTIEALAKAGQVAAARARGHSFLNAYANSPYAAKVRQIISEPSE